jgi:gamma-glutamylcyclotransferase (GGCT)/AIG2-like uncharacterized protein YtfP
MGAIRLVVYGSLKRGFPNADQLWHARFIGEISTSSGFSLRAAGEFPVLVREGVGAVFGELFSVQDEELGRLDDFEGCPDVYQREEIVLADGGRAMAYTMTADRARIYPPVPGGIWRGPRSG